jgi:hypothetical protein
VILLFTIVAESTMSMGKAELPGVEEAITLHPL